MRKLWSKSFTVILLISLAVMTGHYMLLTSLSDYTVSIGGTAADAGIISGAFTLAALIFRPLSGKLTDDRGRRIILTAGTLIIFLMSTLYPLLAFIPALIIIRFVNGAGYSAYTTASGTALADIVPPSKLNLGLSLVGIAGTIATAFGPMLGLGLATAGYNWFFLFIIILNLLAFGGSFAVSYEKHQPRGDREAVRGKLFEKSALRVSITLLIMNLPLDAIMIFIAGYGKERNMQLIGLFFTIHAVAMLLSKMFLGWVADRIGPSWIFLTTMATGIGSMVILAFAQSDAVMLLAAFIFGFPMGITTTLLNTILIRTSPRESLGAANATFMAFSDIGFGLGSMILGFAIQYLGFTAFFLIAAACFTLSVIAYLALVLKPARQLHIDRDRG